jgi:glycosyltransferase involved in cell wall biosynthesis
LSATVSVVVPSLNSREFIANALASALEQDGVNFEVVVQDGGSTDGTPELVRRLADERVQLIVEPDEGQADALNRAVRIASGEWIFWLNADDLIAPSAFANAAAALDERHDIVFGAWGVVDEEGQLIKHYTPGTLTRERLLTRGTFVFSGSTFFRKELIIERGGFDATLDCCMDYDLLLRIVPGARIARISQDLGYLRSHPRSKSNSRPWAFFREHSIIAFRSARPSIRLITRIAVAQLQMAAYLLTRPIWRSSIWLRLRPAKRW